MILGLLLSCLLVSEEDVVDCNIGIHERISNEWRNVSDEHPSHSEIVWGFWRNKEVCLVQHFLSQDEIEKYGLEEAIWYSLDSQKMGCVHKWQPLKRPCAPKNK